MVINLNSFKITPRENPNVPNENPLLGTNGSAFVAKYNSLVDLLQLLLNQINQPVVRNRFSGDNITQSFVLSVTPRVNDSILVFVGANYINVNDYSVAGNVITFTTPPVPGANNVEVIILRYD